MSNYGPKKMKLYNANDNAKRKARNTNDQIDCGQNRNVKAYSTKVGQLSAKAQATSQANYYKKLNKKQPVKVFTAEEIKALELLYSK